jgi:hypothetical protein
VRLVNPFDRNERAHFVPSYRFGELTKGELMILRDCLRFTINDLSEAISTLPCEELRKGAALDGQSAARLYDEVCAALNQIIADEHRQRGLR